MICDAESSNLQFLVFSDDWGVHPSSSQHIFKCVAGSHKVAWVNTIGMRRPKVSLTDLAKAKRKLAGMLRRPAKVVDEYSDSTIRVYQPTMIPFNDIAAIRRWNRKSVERTMRSISSIHDFECPIVVTTVPNACDYIDAIESAKIVYYCVDDFSEWPGLDKSLILEMEARLVDKADLFIATSTSLRNRLAATGKPTHLLPHGVDLELFGSEPAEEHSVLREIPQPRIGYFGLFDARSDQNLIANMAKSMPDISIVIAGRVEVGIDCLAKLPNVYFVGPIEYRELPALVKGLRVLFTPYVVNALTESLSPLKFKEYLATGKPVVTTPISAAQEIRDEVEIASTQPEWAPIVRGLIASTTNSVVEDRRQRILTAMHEESWQHKAAIFTRMCFDVGNRTPKRSKMAAAEETSTD